MRQNFSVALLYGIDSALEVITRKHWSLANRKQFGSSYCRTRSVAHTSVRPFRRARRAPKALSLRYARARCGALIAPRGAGRVARAACVMRRHCRLARPAAAEPGLPTLQAAVRAARVDDAACASVLLRYHAGGSRHRGDDELGGPTMMLAKPAVVGRMLALALVLTTLALGCVRCGRRSLAKRPARRHVCSMMRAWRVVWGPGARSRDGTATQRGHEAPLRRRVAAAAADSAALPRWPRCPAGRPRGCRPPRSCH